MTSYGNLRRRELRAMPTYQYPQQVFVLAQPDVLVQAGPSLTTDDLSSTSFNGINLHGVPTTEAFPYTKTEQELGNEEYWRKINNLQNVLYVLIGAVAIMMITDPKRKK
jgi:hypothetical protein